VNGTVKATAFKGDGSQLTGKVSTLGDTLTGPLTIQSSLSVSGNIGIGTTEPLNSLHVSRPSHVNAIFERTDTQDHLTAVVGSDGSGLRFSDTNFFFIGTQPYSERNDKSAGRELLRITNTGNVGIGTPAPKAKLHVVGDLLGAAKGSGGEALRIAVGQTPVGATNWVQEGTDGIYVDIDTSTAGFSSVPLYFTSIGGSGHHWQAQGATSIYNQTARSFRVYVFQPGIIAAKAAKERYWHINWIAIGN
jgi:hypothetical protein